MKKILGLVMVIVLALCLGGCGQDAIPKADFSFSAQDFMMDCFLNHDKEPAYSLVKANRIYGNKRIEINGEIMVKSKEGDFQIVLGFRQVEKIKSVLRVSVRDRNILDKLNENDFIKMSCLFEKVYLRHPKEEESIFYFDFYDGILISKL